MKATSLEEGQQVVVARESRTSALLAASANATAAPPDALTTQIRTTHAPGDEPRWKKRQSVPADDVADWLQPALRAPLRAFAAKYRKNACFRATEARWIVENLRGEDQVGDDFHALVGEHLALAARHHARKAARSCGRFVVPETGRPRLCKSRACPCCRSRRLFAEQFRVNAALRATPLGDDSASWLLLDLSIDLTRFDSTWGAQKRCGPMYGRLRESLARAFGELDYYRVIVVPIGGRPHLHILLRCPRLAAEMCRESGRSMAALRDLARVAPPGCHGAIWERVRSLAVRAGFGRKGFYLAPVYDPQGIANYITFGQLKHGVGIPAGGVRLFQASHGFARGDETGDDGTVPRVRRHATECNAPGDSDVDDG